MGVSLFVRKVRFVLEYKGIDYDHDPIVPRDLPEEYFTFSPLGKIPALKIGDFGISDSSVIGQYLDKKFPQKPLIPDTPEGLAKTLWFDEYSDTKMTQTMSQIFFEKFGKPKLFNMESDEERIATLEKEVPAVLNYLEKELAGKQYLLGEDITFGDLGVISNLYNHHLCGYVIDDTTWPNVSEYKQRVLELPFIKSVTQKERQEMPLS